MFVSSPRRSRRFSTNWTLSGGGCTRRSTRTARPKAASTIRRGARCSPVRNVARRSSFLEEALDKPTKRVRDKFNCPNCDKMLAKDLLERTFENLSYPATGALWKRIKFRPVLINYCVGD